MDNIWKQKLPFAIFLTHRRGALILLATFQEEGLRAMPSKTPVSFQSDFQYTLCSLLLQQEALENVEISHPLFQLSLTTHPTAENLHHMYQNLLKQAHLKDKDVSHFIFGIGPGSFTGLRIGCAFINGLHKGLSRQLWTTPCGTVESLEPLLNSFENFFPILDSWKNEICILKEAKDESRSRLSLLDLLFVMTCKPLCVLEGELTPAYGKEPGPVIKLRAERK